MTITTNLKKFDLQMGENLKALRQSAGRSQQEIGDLLGVSFQQIQKYETGQNRISPGKLHILKDYYDVPYDVLFHDFASHQTPIDDKTATQPIKVVPMNNTLFIKDQKIYRKVLHILEILEA